MNPYRRYLISCAVAAFGLILAAGALNLLVDPYDRFGLNRLGVYISAEREYKSAEFSRFAPDAVLLGNSRAALIDVAGLKGHRFFNAAFGSAQIEEMSAFVDQMVTSQKLVVLSLDLNSFPPLTKPVEDPFQPLTPQRALEYILNLQNLEYSARTLFSHAAGKPPDLLPNGSFNEANWAAEADRADDETARRKVLELADGLSRYRFDPARLTALRDLRATLERRGIPLLVYFAPVNARVWKAMEGSTGHAEMLRARDAIKGVLPQTIDLTRSEFSAPEGFFRRDPMHFRSSVGQRLLNERVLATEPRAE